MPISILQVNTSDQLGGAERVALQLHEEYLRRDHRAMLAVGRMRNKSAGIFPLRNDRSGPALQKLFWRLHHDVQPAYGRIPGAKLMARLSHMAAAPGRRRDLRRGIEDFHYPGTWDLLRMSPSAPEILHLHNLHGGYFDLRALPTLSNQVPTILTLHDAWLMSGHCAHSLECERWRSGCGQCPDLSLYPAVRHDATDENWQTKRRIFEKCRLCLSAPSRWLMAKALDSLIAPAIASHRVIANGVDTNIFRPSNRAAAREQLNLPRQGHVLVFSCYQRSKNPWKDYATIREAVLRLHEFQSDRPLILIALGEEGRPEQFKNIEIKPVPFERDPHLVAMWYQSADVYVHAARADTFPNSVLEALACGTPVIATAVGGIPEQIYSLPGYGYGDEVTEDDATGVLTAPGDAEAMAAAIKKMLTADALRLRLATNAVRDVQSRFTLKHQADQFLDWYAQLIESPGDGGRCRDIISMSNSRRRPLEQLVPAN